MFRQAYAFYQRIYVEWFYSSEYQIMYITKIQVVQKAPESTGFHQVSGKSKQIFFGKILCNELNTKRHTVGMFTQWE
jgi:hypothetical protein